MSALSTPYDAAALARDLQTLKCAEAQLAHWISHPSANEDTREERDWERLGNHLVTVFERMRAFGLSPSVATELTLVERKMQQHLRAMAAYCQRLEGAMATLSTQKTGGWAYQQAQTLGSVSR